MRIIGTSQNKLIIIIFVVLLAITQIPTAAAQDGAESVLLDEISEDWPTDMIMIYIETPNKYVATYGNEYNITNLAVLNEISAVEESLDPQKEDYGEDDGVFFVHSISVLIKEIHISQRNVAMAVNDNLGTQIPENQIPGEYAIPQDQEAINNIVSEIPQETLEMFVRDTNRDRVWDTAVMWLAVSSRPSGIEGDINILIDPYYVDPEAGGDDYNSGKSWWERIDSQEIHCRMTPLGYSTSYETYDGLAQVLDAVLPFVIAGILLMLTIFLYYLSKSQKDDFREKKDGKSTAGAGLVLLIIFVAICSSLIFIETSPSPSPELRQFSEEMGGGQMGYVLIRGNPAPTMEAQPLRGGGSMKDIEVLDDMDELQEHLRGIAGVSPYCIVDIMKTIRISETAFPDIVGQMPSQIQDHVNQTIGQSFWDAIHNANDDVTSPWYWYYGKTEQDSLIDIFYDTITIEMLSTFINHDFSKSLMYIQMPMDDAEDSAAMLNDIRVVINRFPVGDSTSNVVIIGEYSLAYGFMTWMVEVMLLFVILALGIIVFAMYFHDKGKKEKGEDEDVEPFIPDHEIGLKGDFPEGNNVPYKYPKYKEPPYY